MGLGSQTVDVFVEPPGVTEQRTGRVEGTSMRQDAAMAFQKNSRKVE
jgi:hypothetical protein